MNVRAIHMSDLFDKCDDIYMSVMIIANRAKQIIDKTEIQIYENEEVEDSIQFSEPNIIIDNQDKPMVLALEEHLNGELEWRVPESEDSGSDAI